jgi:dihydrofolate reductase (EC 1.5.1.3)
MSLILIAALDADGVIGRDGGIPWHLPDDLRRFRRLTTGHTVLMGRRTYASLGRPLPQRVNRVLTRDPTFAPPAGVEVVHDLEAALALPADGQLYVIGGADLYAQTLACADTLELTQVHARLGGDTHFPHFDPAGWVEQSREEHGVDERHAYAFTFVTLRRRGGPL